MKQRESSRNMALLQKKYNQNSGRITRLIMERFYTTLSRLLDKVTAQTVLDAGCGEGHILRHFLADRFPNVIGADLDIARLRYAKSQDNSTPLLCSNLHNIPLPDNAVDLALCLEVLEHVGDPERALREIHRVTRRYVILSVPNEPFWRIANIMRGAYWDRLGNTPEHINHWSFIGFRNFVEQHFRVLHTAHPVTWTFVLAEKR
jgi:ubiquinone/menaquinone biosynthesis C-methylase UbiE